MNTTDHSIKIAVFSSHSYAIDSLQRIAKDGVTRSTSSSSSPTD
jgi:hypothetical protein